MITGIVCKVDVINRKIILWNTATDAGYHHPTGWCLPPVALFRPTTGVGTAAADASGCCLRQAGGKEAAPDDFGHPP